MLSAPLPRGGEKTMEKNVGGADRTVRLVVGPLLVLAGLASLAGLVTLATGTFGAVAAAVLFVVGAVVTYTGVTRKCFLNAALGFDTFRGGSTAEESNRGSKPN